FDASLTLDLSWSVTPVAATISSSDLTTEHLLHARYMVAAAMQATDLPFASQLLSKFRYRTADVSTSNFGRDSAAHVSFIFVRTFESRRSWGETILLLICHLRMLFMVSAIW